MALGFLIKAIKSPDFRKKFYVLVIQVALLVTCFIPIFYDFEFDNGNVGAQMALVTIMSVLTLTHLKYPIPTKSELVYVTVALFNLIYVTSAYSYTNDHYLSDKPGVIFDTEKSLFLDFKNQDFENQDTSTDDSVELTTPDTDAEKKVRKKRVGPIQKTTGADYKTDQDTSTDFKFDQEYYSGEEFVYSDTSTDTIAEGRQLTVDPTGAAITTKRPRKRLDKNKYYGTLRFQAVLICNSVSMVLLLIYINKLKKKI